jgi:hypothetical protein
MVKEMGMITEEDKNINFLIENGNALSVFESAFF